jgi:TetR/AcrR family transcriptional regulator, mexJK operon transcriptional repressor
MTPASNRKHAGRRQAPRRSPGKHTAILDAATEIFLRNGFLGTSMDEVALQSAVSKQTVYQHFASKEALFVEIVSTMTDAAGDAVLSAAPVLPDGGDVGEYLRTYAYRQLTSVLTPRVMQLRRLVIGEVGRFPELAKVLNERGPQRAIKAIATAFEHLAERGLLVMDDRSLAASQFNWLVMSAPLNQAMLLGDGAIPKAPALRRHVAEAVRLFLAAYGTEHPRRPRAR